jgi:Zn finger protein HypA/HybF involved in hydrogenase expression
MKKQFGQFLNVDKVVIKKCPDCQQEIEPKWESCYNNEWCPYCGCNIDECVKVGELLKSE